MVKVCECCGQTLPPIIDIGIKLSAGEQLIVDRVQKAGKHGLNTERLFDLLYADDPNGGPKTGTGTLHVRISQLNRKLKKVGMRIKGEYPGHNTTGFYRLERQ